MAKNVLGIAIAILLAAGVLATILVFLMIPELSQSNSDVLEGAPPLEGDFVYIEEVSGLGSIRGLITEDGTAIFAGIPYSEPPVGERRWARPRLLEKLTYNWNHYDATFARPACPQVCTLPSPEYVCPSKISEDCLHLTIYLPSELTQKVDTEEGYYYNLVDNIAEMSMPVMVYIYGGAFIAGGNGVPLYDARYIAEKGNVIVVVLNYRLGPFGFFYQDNGNSEAALGNYGIWDQIEGLRWVNKYISFFGGNPSQVTLFGQSAGGQSIAVHMVNQYSEPLFQNAIMQSNSFGITFKTTKEAQETCDKFARHAYCLPNDMTCLRSLTMDQLLYSLKTFPLEDQLNPDSFSQLFEPWAPVIDNDLLDQHPFYTFKEGNNHQKPTIYGTTTDEGMFFVIQALDEPLKSGRTYSLLIEAVFGEELTSDIEDVYPPDCPVVRPPDDCDNRHPIDDWVSDYMFTCASRRVYNSEEMVGDRNLAVWWYTFDQQWSFPDFWEEYYACYNLSCHSAELPYVFDMDKLTQFRFSEEEAVLANKLVYYWTNFAKYGDPNPASRHRRSVEAVKLTSRRKSAYATYPPEVEYWPRMYETTSGSTATMMLTASGEQLMNDFMKEKCDFWDDLDMYLNDSLKLRNGNFNTLKQKLNLT